MDTAVLWHGYEWAMTSSGDVWHFTDKQACQTVNEAKCFRIVKMFIDPPIDSCHFCRRFFLRYVR